MNTGKSFHLNTFSYAYVLLVALIFCSCNDAPPAANEIEGKDGNIYKTIVIDSCEYLLREAGHMGFMSHKGNCRFCNARRNGS